MAERSLGMFNISRIDVEADVVNARWQVTQDVTRSATDIDNAHPGVQRQIIGDRLHSRTKEASGILVSLIKRGMAQDRLHWEISSRSRSRSSAPESVRDALSGDFSGSLRLWAGSCGNGLGKRGRRWTCEIRNKGRFF